MRFIFILVLVFGVCENGFSQYQSPPVNSRMLAKMRDSLQLDPIQVAKIDSINNLLSIRKNNLRIEFSNVDSLTKHVQLVERSRDSLYRIVLPNPTFMIYKEKKRNLISNN